MGKRITVARIKSMGYLSCWISIIFAILLMWNEPYFWGMNKISLLHSLFMILLPSLLFLFGLYKKKVLILIISLLWSIPYGVYMLVSSSMYAIIGHACFIYLICIIMLRLKNMSYW